MATSSAKRSLIPFCSAAATNAGQYLTGIEFRRFISEAVEALMPISRARALGPPNPSKTSEMDVGMSFRIANAYMIRVYKVNIIYVNMLCETGYMNLMSMRLKEARIKAGFTSARSAAERFAWKGSTYAAHENGQNNFDAEVAITYGKAFKVSPAWLLTGIGEAPRNRLVPLVGFVSAGAEANLFGEGQGPFDEVEPPDGSTDKTVAVEIRGESLGPLFNGWRVFYDDIHEPPRPELLNELCVLGLDDGRILVKKLTKGQLEGRFTLLSNTEPPIYDAGVQWAAPVRGILPKR
jgi:hypothetical protein